jgi:hypothetical protein
MTEEMLKAGSSPSSSCDPIGVWWGLRSSATARAPACRSSCSAATTATRRSRRPPASVVADLVVDERVSLVLDLSLFRKAGQVRFMTDFAERLYHRNREPLHLMLDEADAFAPQRPQKGAERLLGAIEDLVRRGRARGLGMTLITQRPAVLNKNVLTQIEVLVTLRMVAPQDRAAIDDWVKVHGEPEQREELMASLPSLPIGTAWFWSPGWLEITGGTFQTYWGVLKRAGYIETGGEITVTEAGLDRAGVVARAAGHDRGDGRDVGQRLKRGARDMLDAPRRALPRRIAPRRARRPTRHGRHRRHLPDLPRHAAPQRPRRRRRRLVAASDTLFIVDHHVRPDRSQRSRPARPEHRRPVASAPPAPRPDRQRDERPRRRGSARVGPQGTQRAATSPGEPGRPRRNPSRASSTPRS